LIIAHNQAKSKLREVIFQAAQIVGAINETEGAISAVKFCLLGNLVKSARKETEPDNSGSVWDLQIVCRKYNDENIVLLYQFRRQFTDAV